LSFGQSLQTVFYQGTSNLQNCVTVTSFDGTSYPANEYYACLTDYIGSGNPGFSMTFTDGFVFDNCAVVISGPQDLGSGQYQFTWDIANSPVCWNSSGGVYAYGEFVWLAKKVNGLYVYQNGGSSITLANGRVIDSTGLYFQRRHL